MVVTESIFWIFTCLLGFERLLEMVWARRNEKRLKEAGFEEMSGKHFRFIVLLHLIYFISLILEYRSEAVQELCAAFVAFFILTQLLRFWVMSVIGSRFTTRILVKRDEPLINRGPYRFIRHPIYLVVELEIISLGLVVGCYWTAFFFGIANALLLLLVRIPAEDRALGRRGGVVVK